MASEGGVLGSAAQGPAPQQEQPAARPHGCPTAALRCLCLRFPSPLALQSLWHTALWIIPLFSLSRRVALGLSTHSKTDIQVVSKYLQEHGSFVGREVGSQDVPEPDDDSVTPMKATVVHRVLPKSNAEQGSRSGRQAGALAKVPCHGLIPRKLNGLSPGYPESLCIRAQGGTSSPSRGPSHAPRPSSMPLL